MNRGRMVVAWALASVAVPLAACDSEPTAPVAEVAYVELTPLDFDLDVGDTLRIQAIAFDADDEPILNYPMQWSVGSSATAEVSSTGLVRGKKEGITFIRVRAGEVTEDAGLRVIDPVAPLPVITAVQPSSATAGGAGFSMVILGTAFGEGSVVLWGGQELSATRVSDTELRASVPAALIADAGTAEIRVFRVSKESAPLVFTIYP